MRDPWESYRWWVMGLALLTAIPVQVVLWKTIPGTFKVALVSVAG